MPFKICDNFLYGKKFKKIEKDNLFRNHMGLPTYKYQIKYAKLSISPKFFKKASLDVQTIISNVDSVLTRMQQKNSYNSTRKHFKTKFIIRFKHFFRRSCNFFIKVE